VVAAKPGTELSSAKTAIPAMEMILVERFFIRFSF
jgi:hypothetical protein